MTPSRRLRALDVALIVLALATVLRFVVAPRAAEEPIPFRLQPGLTVPSIGVDWSTAPRTVVLVRRSTCPACQKSAGFYGRLATQLAAAKIPLRVVSSETSEAVSSWLASASIHPVAVTSGTDLPTMGLVATPTLLIVNAMGVVTDLWVGVLSSEHESALAQRLHGSRAEPMVNVRLPHLVTRSELAAFEADKYVLIDVRERTDFAESSTGGAINIPSDELVDRVPLEFDVTRRFVVDCLHSSFSRCEVGAEILADAGVQEIAILVKRR